MLNDSVYSDISARCGGSAHIGVAGSDAQRVELLNAALPQWVTENNYVVFLHGCDGADGVIDYGDGYGGGDGDGDGIKIFDGHTIEMIDGVQTIIDRAHGNFARGWILGRDLTLSPCCVVRNEEGMAAHGETMREAMTALMEKEMENRSPEERVEAFVACHDQGKKYPAQDLFEWHHHLTGSCLAGRKTFCRDHGIDIEHDAFTVEEFVRMTKGNYGADVIDLLAERIGMTDVRD